MTTVPTLTIATVDRTAEVASKSLRWTYNTLDFTLYDPASVPALGAAVAVDTPAFSGTVTNVETQADDLGAILWAKVTATNTDTIGASSAPFGLSDTPNYSTTYPYRSLSVRRTRLAGGDELRASLECFQEGLEPGDTVQLTNALEGFSATNFTITDMTVGWETDDQAVYRLNLGDPWVTMSVWVNSTEAGVLPITTTKITDDAVTTAKIAANAITATEIASGVITATHIDTLTLTSGQLTLKDPAGETVLSSAGFGTTWRKFITSGFYNADFSSGPPTPGSAIFDDTNPLPFWTTGTSAAYADSSFTWVADSTSSSGYVLRMGITGGTGVYSRSAVQNGYMATSRAQSMRYGLVASFIRRSSPAAPTNTNAFVRIRTFDSGDTELDSYISQVLITDYTAGIPFLVTLDCGEPFQANTAYLTMDAGILRLSGTSTGSVDLADIRLVRFEENLADLVHSCQAANSGAQTLSSAGTWYSVTFSGTDNWDIYPPGKNAMHSSVTNNDRIYVRKTGLYQLSLVVTHASNTASGTTNERRILGYEINGTGTPSITPVIERTMVSGAVAFALHHEGTWTVSLSDGDYVRFAVNNGATSGTRTIDYCLGTVTYLGSP